MVFPSVYEMTNPLTTVAKQHMWEYFTGNIISPRRWKVTVAGGTVSMADSANDGVKLSVAGVNYKATISSGGDGNPSARQFYHQNCTFIASFKFDAGQASTIQAIGLSNGTISSPRSSGLSSASISDVTNLGIYYVDHGDGSGVVVNTSTTDKVDTNWNTVKISLNSSSHITTTINGNAIGSTITTDVPTHRMAPVAHIDSGVTKNMYVNYMEVYNT